MERIMNNSNTYKKGISTLLFVIAFLFSGNLLQAQNPEVGSIVREVPAGQYTNSTTLQYEVQFTKIIDNNSLIIKDFELVTVSGTPRGNILSITGTGNTYYVNINGVGGDGDLRLDFIGEVVDFDGNTNRDKYDRGEIYTIDNTVPSIIRIARRNPTIQKTNLADLEFLVTLSEEIQTATLQTFDFTVVGTPTATISSVTRLSATQYSVKLTNVSRVNGDIRIDYTGSITDLAGNFSNTRFSGGESYTIDLVLPTVSSITRLTPATQRTSSTTVVWNIRFSEDIQPSSFTIADLALAGTPAGTISSITRVSDISYNVTVTGVTGNGNLYLNFSGDIIDIAGNLNKTAYNTPNYYIIDQSGFSVVSISRYIPIQQYTNQTNVTFRVVFSDPMTSSSVNESDFKVRTTGTATGNIDFVYGSGNTYYVNVSGVSGDGSLFVDFDGTATDDVGNNATIFFNRGENYIIDNTNPEIMTVDIRSNNSNPSIAVTGSNVTVRFTVAEIFSIISSQIEGHTATNDNVFGTTGTVSYIMKSSDFAGNVTFEISITDRAGNRTTFDTTTNGSAVEFIKTTPSIILIEQPSDMIECEGTLDQFLFAIAASSDRYYKLAYQWYKDDRKIGSASLDNGIYSFDTLDYRMSGVYKVEIWAVDLQLSGGTPESQRISPSIFSEPTNAYVLQNPSFLRDIKSVTTQIGNNAVFTFDANIYGEHNMENPTYWTEIDWFKGDVELVDNDRFAGTDGSILTVQNINASDFAANYRVRLMSDCDTIWSNNFAITDEPIATITVQPINVEGCEGTVVQLSIDADATVQGTNLLYQWMVNGQPIANEANKFSGAMTSNLNVTLNPALNYNGTEQFTCKVTPVGFPNNGTTSAPAMITWKSAPVLTADLAANYSAKENEAITLFVTATGENVIYTWTKNGADLNNDNDTLSFASLTVADAGDYVVTVSNECGEITSMVSTLVVTTGPIEVVTSVDAKTGLGLSQNYPNPFDVSSTITFNTQVSGNASLTMTDMLGNTVAPLFNGFVNSGVEKTIQLNVNDMNLNTGTYFITLRMGDRVETRQISVVR